jgi:peroxiredoxin
MSTADTPPVRLADQLASFKSAFKQRATPERVALMESATATLRASGIEKSALKVGDRAPAIALTDALGRPFDLADAWPRGPLVVVFYRGGWCPYCNLELRAWQERLPQLQTRGATLVAISPQTPDNSLSTAQKNALAFPVLSDSTLQAAQAFGVCFTLPQELADLYASVGNDLPVLNGNGQWALPIPATYVVRRDGSIAFAHVEADYRERAEPDDVLAIVEGLRDIAAN